MVKKLIILIWKDNKIADWKTKPNQENETKYRDYAIDNTPLDFANYTEQSDPDLHTIYNETRKRELYIYPLNNLIKNANKPNLYTFLQMLLKFYILTI